MNKVGSQKKSVITRKYKMYVSISASSKPSMYVYNEGYFLLWFAWLSIPFCFATYFRSIVGIIPDSFGHETRVSRKHSEGLSKY